MAEIRKSVAREGRALVILLALLAAYVAGSAQTDCWGLIMAPSLEGAK